MADQHNRIDYIEFPAVDIAATKEFYAAIFGWKFTDYGPDYVSFEDGRLTGGFEKTASPSKGGPLVPQLSKDVGQGTPEAAIFTLHPYVGPVLVILFSSQPAKTQAAIIANGGTISKPIFTFPGGRRFHFLDPNGNELAVWSEK